MKMTFNRNPISIGKSIPQPSQEMIKHTPALHQASLDDAIKFGGELTRQALGAMDLQFDRKHIIVDTKVHMLVPKSCPALGGWHNDGVPRGSELDPMAKKAPNIQSQEELRDSRFHLLVTGEGCLTQFLHQDNVELDVPDVPDTALYRMVDTQVAEKVASGELSAYEIPTCTAVQWDWWNLHTAQPAKQHEWRFLIRVTETDLHEPKTDLRDIIRTQQQLYMPYNVGW